MNLEKQIHNDKSSGWQQVLSALVLDCTETMAGLLGERIQMLSQPAWHAYVAIEYHDYQSLYALEPILSNKRSTAWEVWALQLRSPSLISTRESLHTATKTQRSQKKKNKIFSHEAKEVLMINIYHSKFSSVQLLSRVRLFAIPWTAACQASLSITNCRSLPKLMPIKSVMPSSHLILCRPLLLPPPIPPSISLFQWVNSSHEVAKVLEFQL